MADVRTMAMEGWTDVVAADAVPGLAALGLRNLRARRQG